MRRVTRQNQSRISEGSPSIVMDDRYVTKEAFNAMIQEMQSMKSLLQDQAVTRELTTTSDDSDSVSTSNMAISDHNHNRMVMSIYESIPQYNGDGDIQKLLDFVDKVNDYLSIADIMPIMPIVLITVKLTGTASLL